MSMLRNISQVLHSEEHLCKSPACRAAQSGCQQFCVLLVEDAKEPGVHGGQGIAHRGFGPRHWGSSVSLQHGGQVGLISSTEHVIVQYGIKKRNLNLEDNLTPIGVPVW